MGRNALGVGEDGGNLLGHGNLIHAQVGVRRDDCAPCEVHALAAEIPPKSPLLALKPLHKAPVHDTNCQTYILAKRCMRKPHPACSQCNTGTSCSVSTLIVPITRPNPWMCTQAEPISTAVQSQALLDRLAARLVGLGWQAWEV